MKLSITGMVTTKAARQKQVAVQDVSQAALEIDQIIPGWPIE